MLTGGVTTRSIQEPQVAKVIAYTLIAILLAGAIYSVVTWGSPTLLETAEKSMSVGDNEAAIHAFRLHLVHFPDASDVRLKLAGLMAAVDPVEAVEHLQLIAPGDASYEDALRQTALICLQTDRTEEAEEALLRLEASRPDDYPVQLSLAELYFHQKDFKSALPRAVHASTLQPSRAETWLLVAEIRDELRQKPEMIVPLQKAIELNPELYEAHLNLAYAYHAAGQLTEAANEARWCLTRNSKEAFAYRILASVARGEGRLDDAWAEIRKAMKLAPRDVDCRILEADLLLYDRKPDEAYRRLKEIYDEQRETYRYLGSLARAAAASGHIDEARQLHQSLEDLRSTENKMNPEFNLSRSTEE